MAVSAPRRYIMGGPSGQAIGAAYSLPILPLIMHVAHWRPTDRRIDGTSHPYLSRLRTRLTGRGRVLCPVPLPRCPSYRKPFG